MTDKGQLLSDEQIMAKFCKGCNMSKECAEEQTICLDYKATLKERKPIVQAQRDLTASIYEKKLKDQEAKFLKEKAEFGLSVNEAAYAQAQKKIFKLLVEIEGLIYYRPDAPYKTTIDWDGWEALKSKYLK